MSDIQGFIDGILSSPVKGVLVASATGFVGGVVYWLNRLDDARTISSATKACILGLGILTIGSGIFYFSQPAVIPNHEQSSRSAPASITPPAQSAHKPTNTPSSDEHNQETPKSDQSDTGDTTKKLASNSDTLTDGALAPPSQQSQIEIAEDDLKKIIGSVRYIASALPLCAQIRARISRLASPFPMLGPFQPSVPIIQSPNADQQRLQNLAQELDTARKLIVWGKNSGCIAD